MRIFSGIQPTGDKHLGNLIGGFRQYAAHAGARRELLLHRRPALDHRRLRPGRLPRADARPRRDALRDRPRPRALDRLRPEPRARARRGGVAARLGHELRPARPDDAVQGQGRPAGVRLVGALHLPGADGRRHPALPDRHRPDRRRPAPAPRAGARHRRALQHPLRRDVHGPGGRLPGGRRADHGPAGADEQDVHDRRHAAGDGAAARRARRDPEEVQLGRDGLRQRGAPGRRQAGRHEPDRHPLGAHRARSPEAIEARYDGAATGSSRRTSARRSWRLLAPIQERYRELRADPGELQRLLGRGAEKARDASEPTLEAMYERMGFVRRQ